jgi:outer membrane protein assembly factor BamD
MVSVLRRSWTAPALVALAAALALSGCAAQPKKQRLVYEERPVELLYSTGAARLDARQWTQAVDYFSEVERQHPYSEWSRRAILMTAYANYQSGNYLEAIGDSDRFLSLYPGNPSAAYAHYLKAICYFDQIVDVGRDQAATGQALAALRDVVQRYPKSEFAADARLKIDMVNDQLAGKEMAVGRYYLRHGDTLAAIGRFQTVLQRYQTTTHAAEALYRLALEHGDLVGRTREQVDVPRGSKHGRVPRPHEERALEHEAIRVLGSRQPMQEALHGVELQQVVERPRPGARLVEQACVH